MRSTGFLQNEFMPAGSSGRNVTSKKLQKYKADDNSVN